MTIKRIADSGLMIMVIYILIFAMYGAVQPSALSAYSIQGLFNNSLPLMLAAAGATFVILQGGFDLSVAGTISLVNAIVAVLQFDGALGAIGMLAIALAVGILVGAINGFVVAYLKVQAIAALLILRAPGGYVSDFMTYELTGSMSGIPVAIIIATLVALLWFVFRRTNAGRNLLAVGQDAKAAELSGINVARTQFFSFIWAGALYALAAYFLAALTSTGSPSAGEPFLLLTFAAVALGGTAFGGGRGSVTASLLGAATLVLMQKLLFSVGVSSFYTGMIQGMIMVLAVLFSGAVQFVVDRRNII